MHVRQRAEVIRSSGLRLGGSRHSATITSAALKAVSALPYHGPGDVAFRLLGVPRLGHLLRSDDTAPSGRGGGGGARAQRRRLTVGSVFTQVQMCSSEIFTEKHKIPHESFEVFKARFFNEIFIEMFR